MADSDSERGSDAGDSEDGGAGFDPVTDMDKLSDKDRRKWEKRLKQWRIFLDFVFRHVCICTYKINAFEKEDLLKFMLAMEKAEMLRGQKKLKKSESPNITCYKVMKECTDMLIQQKYVAEANAIKEFLNITGRMRGMATIAGGFFKALKKGKIKGIDKIKYYVDFWKGFTIRSYDYSQLSFKNANPESFNGLERKYLVWPTVVKTALHLSQKFLKKVSESTGLDLIPPDAAAMKKYLEAPEFVLASNMEDQLFDRVNTETKSFLGGKCIHEAQYIRLMQINFTMIEP